VVVLGGYVTAAALSTPAGPPVLVGGAVRVAPPSGWEVAGRSTSPPGVRLTRGNGNLDVLAVPSGGDALALVDGYVERVLRPNAERLSVSPRYEEVRLRSGLPGVRVSYLGAFGRGQTPIEGEVTAVVSPDGVGVVFDGWAPRGLLPYVKDDIDRMIDTAEVA